MPKKDSDGFTPLVIIIIVIWAAALVASGVLLYKNIHHANPKVQTVPADASKLPPRP